ncbi:ring-cleaving dioxygenase [Luteolibacter flavescens]|uniref:Ring-cleaving dioxygenase n=1 Tax=Luteolibacter flavescens TaxID=1859460 RepID=A0ABT3FUH7_9BACT|nr:ring-cleaving dioxygenase [Luteolibacter flavescens]MCW1887244.1 ring-cleaving dioxygenase [Luteolibacter flavescens]
MKPEITGIHHVTAIASDPQRNIDFYAGLLGLRMVKKTVNFDDPSAYHLYYGDENGSPGSIVTFFYWPGHDARGRVGSGQTTALVFSAPEGSLGYWQERLEKHGIAVERKTRFGEDVLAFADPDQIPVEIVAVADDSRSGWTGAGITAEHALRGLHTAELTVAFATPTEALLSMEMGFRLVKREGDRARFEAGLGGSGRYADVIQSAGPRGLGGSGTIHHIAWSVPDDETELRKQAELQRSGYQVSPVMDRDYFHSIYYREKGGILFEIATENPGFAVDEDPDALGTGLKLPRQHEHLRARIEKILPPLNPATTLS